MALNLGRIFRKPTYLKNHAILRNLGKPDPGPAPTPRPGHKPVDTVSRPPGVTWTPASFLGGGENLPPLPAFTWCTVRFTVPQPEEAWNVLWKLTFDADCDALIFLNGKFVGRYVTIGPQRDFYLPEPYLAAGENNLTFVLAYTDQSRHLRQLQVAAYPEYSVRRTRLEFEW